ncbi:hypothetical protein BG015_006407 [Linnemannia schmuckeri]|uniref:Uncharacterized protein n=1 Tax=Linnemannia schmuckeri TaxID=64567 RepID=A0A9P5RZU0_9FUNG|nr:hypothetical protein BG015_006407 [Linnemannia schmuckeri]
MSLKYHWTGNGYISGFRPTLLAELFMREESNAIREKPNWWLKLKDLTIIANWRRELLEESSKREERFHMTEEQIDYVFKELDWFAQKRQEQIDNDVKTTIDMVVEGTRRSNGLIPEELRDRLLKYIKKLEDVLDDKKDWHPGSDEKVLDLVHPSLFPFVAGRTRVTEKEAIPPLDFITAGKIFDVAPVPKSSKSQVKARSYINNLHPVEYKDMYPVLEEILEKFLPMFEEVLAEIAAFPPNKLKANRDWYGPLPECEEDQEYDWDEDEDEDEDEGDDDGQGERTSKAPKESKEPKEVKAYHQVYLGGTWHVEGMANENIVATETYYYDTVNITDSRIKFRIQIEELGYEQSDDRGTKHLYGVKNHGLLRQRLDGIETKQDRCLVFPNIFQHKVQSFRLTDPTKLGYRMTLAFFLVNPEEPILSATFVPPQQKD